MTLHEKAVEAAEAVMYGRHERGFVMRPLLPGERNMEAAIRAYLAAMEAEGFVLVPKEPTEEMLRAPAGMRVVTLEDQKAVYEKIIAAAPSAVR